MWLVVGLGNPGAKYARNRHNIGFRVVEAVASRHGLGEMRSGGKLGGYTATGIIVTPRGRQKVVLLEPMEFMNLSGFAVQRAMNFYGVELADVLVVHDEIDLELGVVRLKQGGGHGGHNGLRSIIADWGTADFLRVRVGVGRPPAGHDPASYLLSDFGGEEVAAVPAIAERAAEAVTAIVEHGLTAAMNRFNAQAKSGES